MSPAPAVVVHELRVERGGRTVLPSISVEIPTGAVTGLLGPSGCGKTTLLRAIVGVQQVAGGTVTVLDLPAGARPLRRRVAYMTQAPSVYADLSIDENLYYFGALVDGRDRIDDVVGVVGLGDRRGSLVRELSGGERSRTSLAVALLGAPELLVLDEPTVGLDPLLRRELWATFHRLADEGGTLLVSTHVMDEADRCDRLLLMREGQIIADDTPDRIREQTGTADIEAAFLALVDAAAAEGSPR
jgi:ABC-2 type transport system ATP-binding protein